MSQFKGQNLYREYSKIWVFFSVIISTFIGLLNNFYLYNPEHSFLYFTSKATFLRVHNLGQCKYSIGVIS